MFTQSMPNQLAMSGTRGIRRVLADLWQRQKTSSCIRRDCKKLSELPDYLLDDIGVTRAMIAETRRRHLW